MGDTKYSYDVFVSYSDQDADWVKNWLVPRLREAGLRVCIDVDCFEVGTPALVNMERAINESRKTLLVLTPDWVASEWTPFESLLVQTEDPAARHRHFIPLVLQPTQAPIRLAALTSADFTDPSNWNDQLNRVVHAVEGELSSLGVAEAAPLSCFVSTKMTLTDVRSLIRDVLARLNIQPLLVEERGAQPESFAEFLIPLIKGADFAITEVSEASPGVIAEASLAIALSKPLFVLARKGTVIPTMLQDRVVIYYQSYVELDRQLERVLITYLSERLSSHHSASNNS